MNWIEVKRYSLLLIVGLPLAYGIYLRLFRTENEKFIFGLKVSTIVFLAIGIGYAFAIRRGRPPEALVVIGVILVTLLISTVLAVIVSVANQK